MSKGSTKRICFVMDSEVGKAKRQHLAMIVAYLKNNFNVDFLNEDATENDALVKLQSQGYDLTLLPWKHYLEWPRIEAHYGLSRSEGPVVAGYFSNNQVPQMDPPPFHQRAIFLGLGQLTPTDLSSIISNLIHEKKRSGLQPLMRIDGSHYYAPLKPETSFGILCQWVEAIPEMQNWKGRWNEMRCALSNLWELRQGTLAHFECAVDESHFYLRFCYTPKKKSNKELLSKYWPDPSLPLTPERSLQLHSDLLRVHPIQGINEVEVTLGYYQGEADQPQSFLGHFWLEPLSQEHYAGSPLCTKETKKRTTLIPLEAFKHTKATSAAEQASNEVYELKNQVRELQETLTELRSGGVGGASPLPPADPLSLLDRVEEFFVENQHRIGQLSSDQAEGKQAYLQKKSSDMSIHRLKKEQSTWITRMEELMNKVTSEKGQKEQKGVKKVG